MAKSKNMIPPPTDAELKAPITSKNFFRRAEHFIHAYCAGQSLPVISPGSPTWLAWREYFERHLGWTPVMMRKLIDGALDKPEGFTVPSMDPQTFDGSFREREEWKPLPPPLVTPREQRETKAQLEARFPNGWQIRKMPAGGDRKYQYRSLTDDELRALYPPKAKPEEAA